MKSVLMAAGLAGLLVFAAQAQGGANSTAASASVERMQPLSWNAWADSFRVPGARVAGRVQARDQVDLPDLDVVDAYWMALTMWGEARGSGEDGMRAVGHVIDNRRKAGRWAGPFVTDTVSEAFQFSCWNQGDPNLRAMQNVDRLPPDSHDRRMWVAARRIAEEIMAGRSDDPTGGALFYHAAYVAPRWSQGIPPVRIIGNHLFFRTAH